MQPSLDDSGRRVSLLTILQLIVSGLGLTGSITGAGILTAIGLANIANTSIQGPTAAALFSLIWIFGLLAALALPSLFFSVLRLRGANPKLPRFNSLRIAGGLVLLWPLILALGSWASVQDNLSWILLPPLQILAVGLPVWSILEFARHKLPLSSTQQRWGIVNFSLFITTPLVVIVETLMFLFLAVLFIAWLLGQPALVQEIESIAQHLLQAQADPESILPVILPYLQKPGVILGLLAGLSGLIPLIEEFLKPLALWFLPGRRLTPAQGFIGGALCGGAFALLESLLSLSNPVGQGWSVLAAGRAGTALLHITTTALIGWAIASARQNQSYLQLLLVYLLSTGLHGLWNALSVFWGMSTLYNGASETPAIMSALVRMAPAGLIFLALLLLAVLWATNRRLRQMYPTDAPIVYNSP